LIVADASVVLAWAYEEINAELAEDALRVVARQGAIAPAIWPMEIANSLELSLLRKRISLPQYEQILGDIRDLDVEVEELSVNRIWGHVAFLSRKHALTVYDAQYLEMALRLQLPLATFDQQLAAAARAEGIPVLP
jgi:predicted nucleic acid-binding protein